MLVLEGYTEACEDFILTCLANQDATNPYILDGIDFTPPVVSRAMLTYEDVRDTLREAMVIHNLKMSDVLAAVTIPPERVDAILSTGVGNITEYMQLFDAVGVNPVTIPSRCLEE